MRSNVCWAVTWRSANRAKICAAFLPATAIRSCENSSPEKSCPRKLATCRIRREVCRPQEASVSSLFPMFLKLEGRQCLVVGAGKVGEPKIGGLLETGGRLRVVALAASPAVREWARAGRIELVLRPFSAEDLEGAFLAIVATNSRGLNEP